jgi:hypothetical protein
MMSSGGGCSLLSSFEGGNLMHESLFQLSKIGTSSLVKEVCRRSRVGDGTMKAIARKRRILP